MLSVGSEMLVGCVSDRQSCLPSSSALWDGAREMHPRSAPGIGAPKTREPGFKARQDQALGSPPWDIFVTGEGGEGFPKRLSKSWAGAGESCGLGRSL